MKKYLRFIFLIFIAFVACEEEILTPEEQAQRDEELIQAFIAENNLQGVEKTDGGVYYVITEKPSSIGSFPTRSSNVKVAYVGTLLDGTEFDRGDCFETPVDGNIISGWSEGLVVFKKTWKGKLIIPSALAYGRASRGEVIPANAVLVFDMEMLSFE